MASPASERHRRRQPMTSTLRNVTLPRAEDRTLSRNDRTAENLAILRRLALNLLRADPAKGSIQTKINRAAWKNEYLLTLISQMR